MPTFKKVTPPATGDKRFKKMSDLQVGESFEGLYLNQYQDPTYGGMVYEVFTLDHELIAINGTTRLNACMGEIETGNYVQITLTGLKDIGKENPLALVEVGVADEDDVVSDLRAAAKRVLGPSTQGGESDADQEARAAASEGGRW